MFGLGVPDGRTDLLLITSKIVCHKICGVVSKTNKSCTSLAVNFAFLV